MVQQNGGVPTTNAQEVRKAQMVMRRLEAAKRDEAVATKALVGARMQSGLVVDPLTAETFKEISVTLSARADAKGLSTGDFTVISYPGGGALQIVADFIVPNGVNYYFRPVRTDVDRNAPYLFGSLNSAAVTPISGTFRVRIFDPTLNDLMGQPFTGSTDEVNNADPVDWFKRLFFNSRVPVRAKQGQRIVMDLQSASDLDWSNSYTTMKIIQMTMQ